MFCDGGVMRIDASNLIAAQSAPRSTAAKPPAPSPSAEGISFESLSFPKSVTEARPPAPVQAAARTTAAPMATAGKGAILRPGSQLDIKV